MFIKRKLYTFKDIIDLLADSNKCPRDQVRTYQQGKLSMIDGGYEREIINDSFLFEVDEYE